MLSCFLQDTLSSFGTTCNLRDGIQYDDLELVDGPFYLKFDLIWDESYPVGKCEKMRMRRKVLNFREWRARPIDISSESYLRYM